MHLADTESQARKDVAFGLERWIEYFREVAALPLAPQGVNTDNMIDSLNGSGLAVIGTPDAAVERIKTLQAKSGDSGHFCSWHTSGPTATRDCALSSCSLERLHRTSREAFARFKPRQIGQLPTNPHSLGRSVKPFKAIQDHYSEESQRAGQNEATTEGGPTDEHE